MKQPRLLMIVLVVSIFLGGLGVIFFSLNMVDSVSENERKLKSIKVKKDNAFLNSSLGEFVDYSAGRETWGAAHPEVYKIFLKAKQLKREHRDAESVASFAKAVETYERAAPAIPDEKDRDFVGSCYRNMAFGLHRMKDYAAALKSINKAIAIRTTKDDLDMRAKIYDALGKTDLAKTDRNKRAALAERTDGFMDSFANPGISKRLGP